MNLFPRNKFTKQFYNRILHMFRYENTHNSYVNTNKEKMKNKAIKYNTIKWNTR